MENENNKGKMIKQQQGRVFKPDERGVSLFFRNTTILQTTQNLSPLNSSNPFQSSNPFINKPKPYNESKDNKRK